MPNNKGTEESSGYSSITTELLLDWQHTGSSKKSNEEINCLVHHVIFHPNFQYEDLELFNATRENQKVEAALEKSNFLRTFHHANVNIKVPSGSKHVAPQTLSIPGLYYCQIVPLIKEAFESPISLQFHLSPFKLFQKHPTRDDSECIYSEMYDSDVFLDEHNKVQQSPTDDAICKREKVVAALMFWSDVTHLATFGTAKLWPIYMLFGNLSKYVRCRPNSGAMKHLAYIPPFPDSLQDQLQAFQMGYSTEGYSHSLSSGSYA